MAEENEGRRTYELGTQSYEGLSTGMVVPVDKSGWSEAKKFDLGIMKGNIDTLSGNISSIDTRIDELGHGLEEVSDTVDTISTSVSEVQARLESKQDKIVFGDGLEYDPTTKRLDVKIGEDITIDDVATVVETVEELKDDMDTKVFSNFPPSMITDSHYNIGQALGWNDPNAGGVLFGSLFNVNIRHEIHVQDENDELTTLLGVYITQVNSSTDPCIFGIYEYQPDYKKVNPDTGEVIQVGTTVALCDTGPVIPKEGFNEFPIKNVNNDGTTSAIEFKSNCLYYACVYLPYRSSNQPFYIAANSININGTVVAGYGTQLNQVSPQLSMSNKNQIKAALKSGDGYTPDLSFNDFGFFWRMTSYPPPETRPSTDSQATEENTVARFYMQIRNAKNWTPPPEPQPPTPGSKTYILELEWSDGAWKQLSIACLLLNGTGSSNVLPLSNITEAHYKDANTPNDWSTAYSNISPLETYDGNSGNVTIQAGSGGYGGFRFTITTANTPTKLGFRNWWQSVPLTMTLYEVVSGSERQIAQDSITTSGNTEYTIDCS